jgi:hypothetical protein
VNSGEKARCYNHLAAKSSKLRSVPEAYRQRNIVEQDVEPCGPLDKVFPHKSAHSFTLSDQLTRVELRDNSLQHLVHDRRQDTLIVIGSQSSVNCRQGLYTGSGENTTGDVDHLKICITSQNGDLRTRVVLCYHSVPLVPVNEAMLRGLARTS